MSRKETAKSLVPVKKRFQFRNNRTLLLMCAPALLFFIVFAYIPMPGLYIAWIVSPEVTLRSVPLVV